MCPSTAFLPLIWLSRDRVEVAVDMVHDGMPEQRIINHGDFVVTDGNIGFGRHIAGRIR